MIGAGGLGCAIGFALLRLGSQQHRMNDQLCSKADALAASLRKVAPDLQIVTGVDASLLCDKVADIVNCTPVGMVGHEGTPLAREAMQGAEWAFDAVCTPSETRFLTEAAEEGLVTIRGDTLLFAQGVDAWCIFTGLPLDEEKLLLDLHADP